MQRVLDRQERAPRLTQQMHLAEIEGLANLLDLGDEPRYLPERQVVRFVGAPRAELIVADDAKAFAGKVEKWRQVLGVAARAAVEQQQRPVARARAFVPDAAVADVDVALLATQSIVGNRYLT